MIKHAVNIDDVIDMKKIKFDSNVNDFEWSLVNSGPEIPKKELLSNYMALKNIKVYTLVENREFMKRVTKSTLIA